MNDYTLGFPIIGSQVSRPALQVILRELHRVLDASVRGDIVEFGCYIGGTSLFIRRMLDSYPKELQPEFHVYDSFAGLPPKAEQDNSAAGMQFTSGVLKIHKRDLLIEFHKAHLQPPIVHKAWFSDLEATDVPEHISFAFLDGDFYDSILDSLKLCWSRLSPGGCLVLDDYQREALPGVAKAVKDFFRQPVNIVTEHNLGIIRKASST